MIKKDLFMLDVDTLSIKYARFLDTGMVFYCYICENAHIGCKFQCERYCKKIKTDKQIKEINIAFVEIYKAKLAELGGRT